VKTNSGPLTEALHRQILLRPEVDEHPIGHTDKVYRYRTRLGHEIAVEKRANYPVLLVAAAAVKSRPAPLDVTVVPAGRKGRNHNVNALPTFRDRPILRLQVRSVSDADRLLECIG
jgi:hypothetical protein